jgi:hypothetical protein
MKFVIILTVLLACGSAPGQNPATTRSDVPKLEGLNAAQQRAVEEYVRQNERPTAELRWIADRRMVVFSSVALRTLFPRFRFVAIRWITEADPAASQKYSIPRPIVETLVLDEDGRSCMPKRTGYWEEFGDLLHTEHVNVTDARSAALVRSALITIYGTGMRSDDRHQNSQWLLGYQEWPYRAISE